MTFTDDDLKRLKEDNMAGEGTKHPWIITFNLEALLARLEAAETLCALTEFHYGDIRKYGNPESGQDAELTDAVEVWRKAAGK